MSADEQNLPITTRPAEQVDETLILHRMIADLQPLTVESRQRLLETVCTFLGITLHREKYLADSALIPKQVDSEPHFRFTQTDEQPPKRFIFDKAPSTDVERVACLAFYLAHYRDTPHFRTEDITALNTEAAQRRFSNTAFSVENATKAGYLVPSVKGAKQLSAAGEQFVRALPDREAARLAMERGRPMRSQKSATSKVTKRRR